MEAATLTYVDISVRLEKELARLKAHFGLAGHLRVVWVPKDILPGGESGNVRGLTIIVHDQDLDSALRTLRHEFLEHLLTEEFFIPRFFEAKAHSRVDAFIDILSKVIFEDG